MPVCGGFELRVSLVIFQDKPALLDAMAEVQRGSTSSQTLRKAQSSGGGVPGCPPSLCLGALLSCLLMPCRGQQCARLPLGRWKLAREPC